VRSENLTNINFIDNVFFSNAMMKTKQNMGKCSSINIVFGENPPIAQNEDADCRVIVKTAINDAHKHIVFQAKKMRQVSNHHFILEKIAAIHCRLCWAHCNFRTATSLISSNDININQWIKDRSFKKFGFFLPDTLRMFHHGNFITEQ